MFFLATFYISLILLGLGLVYKISFWFRYSLDPEMRAISPADRFFTAVKGIGATVFSVKAFTLLKVLVFDVLFQVKTLKESVLRWSMHILIFGGFMLLLLMHALDESITTAFFSEYQSTLNPFYFLRDLFGVMVFIGVGIAVYRRFYMKLPRLKTTSLDRYAIIILAVIMLTGFLLEGVKITSYSRYQEMLEDYGGSEDAEELLGLEAVWVKEYGLVSPTLKGPFDEALLESGRDLNSESCVTCHSRPRSAFLSYGVSRVIIPLANEMDRAGFVNLLWHIHFLACFIGLAYLPFSKMFHIIVSPISLLVNAVMDRKTSDPLNIATTQIMELNACTHCGSCTLRCSVGIVYEEIPNQYILPSEKIGALKAVARGESLAPEKIKDLQEGLNLCTNCHDCTDVCPVGIDLQHLWLHAREAVLQMGCPEYTLLSPLSRYRGFMRDAMTPEQYEGPVRLVADTVNSKFRSIDAENSVFEPERMDKGLRADLVDSVQGHSFPNCFTCKTCTAACPVVQDCDGPLETLGMVPHQIMHATRLGLRDLVLNSKMLWACLGCYQCQQQCPQGVRITDVLYELKSSAFKQVREEALSA